MKFAKKIFVGIIALALLVSCLALAASAEAPECPVTDFEKLHEYRGLDTYLIEDYENYAAGDFVFESQSSDLVTKPVFGFVMSDGAEEKIVKEGENNLLSITNSSDAPVGYKFLAGNGVDALSRLIITFDFKSGSNTDGASDIKLLATLGDYFEDVPLFAANLRGDAKSFTYADYNSDRVIYSEATADAVPALDTWYSVTVILAPINGEYSVKVESEGAEVFSFSDKIADTVGIDSIRLYAVNAEGEEGVSYFDNLFVYNGSAIRNVSDSENALADILLELDAYAKNPEVDLFERQRIADAYLEIYGEDEGASYYIPTNITRYEEMKACVDDIPAFRNRIAAEIFIYYVDELVATEGYYNLIDYRDSVVKEHYNKFVELLKQEEVPGFNDKYDDEITYAEAIENAIELYDDVNNKLLDTKMYSENFVKQIEEGYDPQSKNYSDMLSKYNLLSLTVSKIDLTYKYNTVNANTKYPTVADAYAEYLRLEEKIAKIAYNVSVFVPAVKAMDTSVNDSITADAPYLTKNFEELYANYLIASSVYNDKYASVHVNLDPATFVSSDFDLASVIEEYKVKKAFMEERINACNTFVSIINGAKESTYYVTVINEIEKAKLYLDTDIENGALERYEGVAEAIEVYYQLLERVEKCNNDAAAYISAVEAIDLEAGYVALRAAVDAAVAKQADGSVTGIAGVEDANIKLATALYKVQTLEGYSKTLIDSVDALKKATTLAERRALIFTAKSVADGAESAIEGVDAARAALTTEIAKYDADVAAINSLFGGVVSDASSVISAAVPDASVAAAAGAIGAVK